VREAASDDASARYGLGEGRLDLREALVEEMRNLYDATLCPEEIAITAGANQATYLAIQTLAKAGDEVILTSPCFFNNMMVCQQLGIKQVYFECREQDGFVPNPKLLKLLITKKTRSIVLVSPANPTGVTIPPDTLLEFAKVAHAYNVALIVDETYRDLLPPDWPLSADGRPKPHSLFSQAAQEAVGAPWTDYLVHLYSCESLAAS
jgi:aspartate/methionine/tyrosine aminotransferase